jgi:hypothetical protein
MGGLVIGVPMAITGMVMWGSTGDEIYVWSKPSPYHNKRKLTGTFQAPSRPNTISARFSF